MSRIIDPFDELAQLFLTDEEEAENNPHPHDEHGGATVAPKPVELLLVGHLPVRADLWLRPYAEAIARDVGTVALVRLDSDEPSVEVLGKDAPPINENASRSLRQTLREIAPHVAMWILRPGGSAQPDAIMQAGGSRITIISSADEAALVAAYQRIKDLVDAARAAGCDLPALGVAILGSAEHVARSMVDRLNRTTRTFLGMELPLVATLRQMDAGSRSQAYARFLGERSPELSDVIGWLEEAGTAPPALLPVDHLREAAQRDEHAPAFDDEADERDAYAFETPGAREPTVTPATEERRAETERELMPGDRDVLELLQQKRRSESEPAREEREPAHVETRAAKTVKMAPRPVMMHEPKSQAADREPSAAGAADALASFIEGLTPIEVRCPGHERVELAIDTAGRFHLLCKEDAMRELHLVEAWTRSHRELLTMALPSFSLDPNAAPVLHVITQQPVTVADLHGSPLHLHVLAPVVIEGKTGWYAAPLNSP